MAGTDRERKRCIFRRGTSLSLLIRRLDGTSSFHAVGGPNLSTYRLFAVVIGSMVISGFLWSRPDERQMNTDSALTEPVTSEVGGSVHSDSEPEQTEAPSHPNDDASGNWDRQPATIQRSFRNGELLVKLEHGDDGADVVNVYRDGRLILHESRQLFDAVSLSFAYNGVSKKIVRRFDGGLAEFISNPTKTHFDPFINLNSDGVPDLIIAQTSNGPFSYSAYSLGRRARLLGTINTMRSEAQFKDIDGDGKCEALTYDSTFFGWNTCNADSAAPFVILKLGKHRFELATSIMKAAPPTLARQHRMLSDWSKACGSEKTGSEKAHDRSTFDLSPCVWSDLLDLIYSGNAKTAFKLLDQFWGNDKFARNIYDGSDCRNAGTGRERFIHIFLNQLSCSPYLRELKQLNQDDARIRNLKPHRLEF